MKKLTNLFAVIAIVTLSIVATSCGDSRSGKRKPSRETSSDDGAQASTPEKKPTEIDLQEAINNSYLAKSKVITYDREFPVSIFPVEHYENMTEFATIDSLAVLIYTLERQTVYIDPGFEKGSEMSTLDLVVLKAQGGHYAIHLLKKGNAIAEVAIYELTLTTSSTTGRMPSFTSAYMVYDGNANGLLNPVADSDYAIWPAKSATSKQFCDQTQNQHNLANARYMQLVGYLTRIVASHEQRSPIF
ncbi:MAG: hypothetical protein KBB70_00495 [Candidatus Pacebacteria bacterium]|jgi:hypothetical protein|nr:hypothetical protein [Candidatus Paceibacterota bacterium]